MLFSGSSSLQPTAGLRCRGRGMKRLTGCISMATRSLWTCCANAWRTSPKSTRRMLRWGRWAAVSTMCVFQYCIKTLIWNVYDPSLHILSLKSGWWCFFFLCIFQCVLYITRSVMDDISFFPPTVASSFLCALYPSCRHDRGWTGWRVGSTAV